MALMSTCRVCKAVIPYGAGYCSGCKPVGVARAEGGRSRAMAKYNKSRDPKYKRFYNSKAWRNMSATYMGSVGYRCEECGQLAVEVHHVDPIQQGSGWNRRLDWYNLQALCLSCHNKKHNRF